MKCILTNDLNMMLRDKVRIMCSQSFAESYSGAAHDKGDMKPPAGAASGGPCAQKRCGLTGSTSPSSCTPTTRAYGRCSGGGTSVIIRRAGYTCWQSISIVPCTSRPTSLPGSASLTARALRRCRRRTRATPSRTRPSNCSQRPARLPRSWPPAPPQNRLASCAPTSRPRFARRSPLTRSQGPLQRHRKRRPPVWGLPLKPRRPRRVPRDCHAKAVVARAETVA